MPWPTQPTWNPSDPVASVKLTNMVTADTYLYNGRPVASLKRAVFYSTTSLSFVDVDAANLILTLTVAGTRVAVLTHMTLNASNIAANYAAATIIMDSATLAPNGDATYGLTAGPTLNKGYPVTFEAVFTGLSAGSHTFKLQWKAGVATGTTSNLVGGGNSEYLITMVAWEF